MKKNKKTQPIKIRTTILINLTSINSESNINEYELIINGKKILNYELDASKNHAQCLREAAKCFTQLKN